MTRARELGKLANKNTLTADNTNNFVGIGSTQPDARLDVDGTVLVGTAITLGGVSGIVSASSFYGDGANLTGVISGVELEFGGNSVGTAVTNINFVGFSSVTAPVSGLATVTTSKQLTIGVRVGSAVTFSITGNTFNVPNRAGGNTAISV